MWPQKRTQLGSETPSDLVLRWKREVLVRYSGKTMAVKLDLDPIGQRKEDGLEGSLRYGRPYYVLGGISYSPYPITLQDFTRSVLSMVADSGHASDMGSYLSCQWMTTAVFHRPQALIPSMVASPPPKTEDMMGQPISLLLCLIVSEGYTKKIPRLVWSQSGGTLWQAGVSWSGRSQRLFGDHLLLKTVGIPPWMLSALLLVCVTEGGRTTEWTQLLLARLVSLSLS